MKGVLIYVREEEILRSNLYDEVNILPLYDECIREVVPRCSVYC